MDENYGEDNSSIINELLSRSLVWFVLACLLVAFFLLKTVRFGEVSGEEVGILLNKMNGNIIVISDSGKRLYNGITHDFFVLDKTIQTIEMTEDKSRGDRKTRDDLKIKTIDGSDVYVDLVVQYKINPSMASEVIASSGTGYNFKIKWVRDYVRSYARNYLGELTTEEFYDASKRAVKTMKAKTKINEELSKLGIIIDSIVIPKKPHFYKEYEEMIKNKKLADQAKLEEQSKALAAKQKQNTMIVTEQNKNNVELEKFSGQMQEIIIRAKAESEKIKQNADAYYSRITIGAKASLYKYKKNAEAILAQKKADAKGIERMKEALEGEGGRNMVKLEYAKKLKNIIFTGQPFVLNGETQRFERVSPQTIPSKQTYKRRGVK